ncbi:acyl-CoA dehydrogenase family protein [Spelaeicoccus albus]|nr:acyl-CoA dehydrogenase family protein [Spelaeicoccus albus]
MDFGFSSDQETFRASVREFARSTLAPHDAEDDVNGAMRPEMPRQMANIGLTGLRIPDKYGGQGAGALEVGIAAEEVARADLNACYLIVNSTLVSEIMLGAADADQCRRWLPSIADGSTIPALVLTEPEHGSDAASLTVKAEPDAGGWRLTGEKTSITMGMYADVGVVLARTGNAGPSGVSAFIVDLDDGHITRSVFDDLGNRPIGRASIYFDGMPVPRDGLLGAEGSGFTSAMRGFDYSRAVMALACLGTAAAALDDAIGYARIRTAFGAPIGTNEGVAFPLVECATRLRAARLLCYEALWRKDQGMPHTVEANMVKWLAPKLAVEIVHQSLLTFGHTGYSSDNPQGRRLRDVIGLEIGDGTAQITKLVVARNLLGRAAAP